MKRIFLITTALILLLCLSGCSNKDKQAFYGVYTFNKVSYLPPLSSSTAEFVNKYFKDNKYTIEPDLFKIEYPDHTFEIQSPNYVQEAMPDYEINDIRSHTSKEVVYQYTICNSDGNKTNWRLYASPDCVWVAQYQQDYPGSQETIMNIYKLSK